MAENISWLMNAAKSFASDKQGPIWQEAMPNEYSPDRVYSLDGLHASGNAKTLLKDQV